MISTSPLLPAILSRRSHERFDSARSVSPEQVLTLLQAAHLAPHLAPSSYNLQPWRFAWALRGEAEFQSILGTLDDSNAVWAKDAAALIVGLFTRQGRGSRPNRWAEHDLGLATAQLVLQAVSDGLAVHSMAGFDADRLRVALAAPPALEPMTVTAAGWPLEAAMAPRTRRPLEETAFRGGWRRGSER
ncbi:MAG: nitroreductase family protein [Myxococcaceae bacterium]